LFLALEAIWINNTPAFSADHTVIRQWLRGRMCPHWAYVAEYIAIFDTKKACRRSDAIRSDNLQSFRVPLQVSQMATNGFFVLKYSGIGVARDWAPFPSGRCIFLSTKKGSTSDECSLHED
jgi:hypothetical protein